MTGQNPDSRVKVLNFPLAPGQDPIRVVVVGGGGPSGGTVDQGDPGATPWLVLDQATVDAIVALGGLFGAAVPDGDDQAPAELLAEFSRLMLYDDVGGNWDRARVRYGGLEARDDYATFEPQRRLLAATTDEPFALPADTRLIRVTNWSTSQRIHVSPAALTDTADDCAFVGVAPATNLSNSEVFPVRLAEVHLWADGIAEATVEAFRGP